MLLTNFFSVKYFYFFSFHHISVEGQIRQIMRKGKQFTSIKFLNTLWSRIKKKFPPKPDHLMPQQNLFPI